MDVQLLSLRLGDRDLPIANSRHMGVRHERAGLGMDRGDRPPSPDPADSGRESAPVTGAAESTGSERQSARAAAAAYMARFHPEWQPPSPMRPLPAPMQIGQALVVSMTPIAYGYDPSREVPLEAPESPNTAHDNA